MAVTSARPDPAVPATVPPAAPQDAEALTVAVIEDVEAFLALREEWDALFARAALPQQVFQSHVVPAPLGAPLSRRPEQPAEHRDPAPRRRAGHGLAAGPRAPPRHRHAPLHGHPGRPVRRCAGRARRPRGRPAAGRLAGAAPRSAPTSSRRASCGPIRSWRNPACSRAPSCSNGSTRPSPISNARVGRDGPSAVYPARERSNHRRRLRRLGERGPHRLRHGGSRAGGRGARRRRPSR